MLANLGNVLVLGLIVVLFATLFFTIFSKHIDKERQSYSIRWIVMPTMTFFIIAFTNSLDGIL